VPTHSLASIDTVRRVVDVAIDRQVTFLAAAIAYYAFVSLIPALLLLVVVATAVFGEAIAVELLAAAGDFLTPAGQEAVAGAISSAGGRTGASVIGVAVLLWSTLKVFRGLDTTVRRAAVRRQGAARLRETARRCRLGRPRRQRRYRRDGRHRRVRRGRRRSPGRGGGEYPRVTGVPRGRLPPDVLPAPRAGHRSARALPGAAIAAVGWTLLQAGFQVYAASAGQFQVYGVIGGILLLVTWLYLAAVVVVVGGVVNVVLAGRDETALQAAPAGGGPAIADAMDRQLQHDRDRSTGMNGESDGAGDAGDEERPAGRLTWRRYRRR